MKAKIQFTSAVFLILSVGATNSFYAETAPLVALKPIENCFDNPEVSPNHAPFAMSFCTERNTFRVRGNSTLRNISNLTDAAAPITDDNDAPEPPKTDKPAYNRPKKRNTAAPIPKKSKTVVNFPRPASGKSGKRITTNKARASAAAKMEQRTNRNLERIHPKVSAEFRKVKAELEAMFPQYTIVVIDGYRTCEAQNEEFAKGRTKPGRIVTYARCGESSHNYGAGLDALPFDENGKPVRNDRKFWRTFVKVVIKHGFESGGTWKKLQDYSHVQSNYYLSKARKLCGKNGCDLNELAKLIKTKNSSPEKHPKGTKNRNYTNSC